MMNNRNLFGVFLILFLQIPWLNAQSLQQGKVWLYHGEEPKTPLPRVAVSVRDAAVVQSDVNGCFQLQFRTLHPGDAIQWRRIELSNYEVMNMEALEACRVSRQEETGVALNVVMCSRKELKALREGYKSVAVSHYRQQLEASRAELERLHQQTAIADDDFRKRMLALSEEYEEKLTHLDQYVDKLARIDLSDLEADEREIIQMVQKGRLEEALKSYENQHLPERLSRVRSSQQQLSDMKGQLAEAELRQARENLRLRQSIERQVNLLRMAGGAENLQKVSRILRDTYLADTTVMEARKEYAFSLRSLGNLQESKQLLYAGIHSAQNPFDKGMLLLDYQDQLWADGDTDGALQSAREAESCLMPLLESNPAVVTRALPRWSLLLLSYSMDKGEDYETSKPLMTKTRDLWQPDSLNCNSLVSYTLLLQKMNDYYSLLSDDENVAWCTRQMLSLEEVMQRRFPWRSTLPLTCAAVCASYLQEGRNQEAQEMAQRALAAMEESLSRAVSSTYEFAFNCYYQLLTAVVPAEQFDLARKIIASEETYHVFDKMRDTELNNLYYAVYNLYKAQVLLQDNAKEEARLLADNSLRVMNASEDGLALAAYLQPDFEARLALRQGDYKLALRQCQQEIDVCKESYEESRDAWDADNLFNAYLLLSKIYLADGNAKKAKKALDQAESVSVFECHRQALSRQMNIIEEFVVK